MLRQKEIDINWKEIKQGIRTGWGRLTDAESDRYKNDLNEIADLIQRKYDEPKKETRKKILRLMESFDNDTDKGLDPDISSYHRSPLDSN
jgi:hypothetical protein